MSELRVGALLGFARECKCSAGIAAGSPAGGTSRGESRCGRQRAQEAARPAPGTKDAYTRKSGELRDSSGETGLVVKTLAA